VIDPPGKNGILVVVDASEDMRRDPFDVTVRSVELRIVVLDPVPMVSAVVHEDVDNVNVADVDRLVIIVNVG
jgi:hypothetical protein